VPGLPSLAVGFASLAALNQLSRPIGASLAGFLAVSAFAVGYGVLRRSDDLPAAIRLLNTILNMRLPLRLRG
jgi:hypothetical protein